MQIGKIDYTKSIKEAMVELIEAYDDTALATDNETLLDILTIFESLVLETLKVED